MNSCARRPWIIDHLWFICDFCQVPREIFSNVSHSLSTAAFAAGFLWAWDRNKFVYQIINAVMISPFPAMWSSWWFGNDSPIRSLEDSSASRIHASLVVSFIECTTPTIFLRNFAGHKQEQLFVSNFLRAFLVVYLNSLSSGTLK